MWQHFLHVYQKPKAGSAFLDRYPALNYRHKISAIGGFDTASCEISISMSDPEAWLDQHIGNRVAVYVDEPLNPIWEGFINRLTFSAGNYQYTISLDEMMNQVQVTYTLNGATSPTTSTAVNNTSSQVIYGIKAGKIDMGFQYSAGTGVAGLRDTILAQTAWPKASIAQGGGNGLVTVEMLGFWHTLSWDNYSSALTGAASITGDIIPLRVLPSIANGTTFFDNADFTAIEANTLTINANRVRGQTAQDVLTELAEVGDGTNTFVVGITPTDYQTGTRRLYYRAFRSTIVYTARRSDGLRVRNLYGMIERPWFVRPDNGIRISDMLPGWNGQSGSDPRETWIESIDYDANQQTVSWTGTDNITTQGAFQLNRYNKSHGRAFGATRRFV